MTDKEKAALAEQFLANPMFDEIFGTRERDAIERLIWAKDETTRHEAALRVQAIRALRTDCETAIHSIRGRKGVAA